ncbi:MAG TPA: hypothetical protein VMV23_10920 [Candidatus Nanopelagicaceae bacterium]|nr:hypothetical protein [Candidatus Nanopelagicaceae bacterium]
MEDLELTALVRGAVPAGPGADSIWVTQPRPGEVVVQAHPSSNFVVVLTPRLREQISTAIREWMPDIRQITFDPHH